MRTQKTLLPLVAVGGSLAGLPASALELGDVTVQSRLGQPLRASIAYALASHEQLTDSCVTLGLGATASGLPGIGRASVSIADGTILLTGRTPVREPMVAARINVDCAYTANLSREYMLFIDPASPAFNEQAAVQTPAALPASAARETPRETERVAARRTRAERTTTPIGKTTRYRVQPGDTLGDVVERIENRPVGFWPAVNTVFEANPDAFIDNDMNKLKAGSWLTIPSFDGSEPVVASVALTVGSAGAAPATAAEVTTIQETAPVETAPAETPSALSDGSNDLSPVTTGLENDNPFVNGEEAVTETVVIPDTEIEGPTTVSASPNVATAVINTEMPEPSSSWLMWLAGSGLAIIIGLLLFGRLFRSRPSDAVVAPVADHPARRATDLDSDGIEVVTHTGYTHEDDSPTAENVTLDADLVLGTGLDARTDVDMEIAEDFGFAAPAELDLELPFEPEPSVPESDTGIFAAAKEDETSILDSEVLPEDDEYDFSVILDATKMPQPEDVTQRDLQAVDISPVDDASETDSYTINTEVDLEILEQDYEDELTATQALNLEILHAAEEIAGDRAAVEAMDGYEITSELTAGLPLTSVTELDVTAQMPSRDDESDDTVETGIHEAATIEMPAAENDETAEMDVDGGTVDTKAI